MAAPTVATALTGKATPGPSFPFQLNRKEILAELLPRLTALRNIARIDGRCLVMQGKLRTYKIHIGSGNILMEPTDSTSASFRPARRGSPMFSCSSRATRCSR